MAWFGFWLEVPAVAVVALFLPLLFPDGHLPSPRWQPAAIVAGAGGGVAAVVTMAAPPTYVDYPSLPKPIGLHQYRDFFYANAVVMQAILLLIVAVGAAAPFSRLRGAD